MLRNAGPDGGHVGCLDLAPQRQRRIYRGVAEAAARIALRLEAALDDVVPAAEISKWREGDRSASSERVKIAGYRAFERDRARRKAGATKRGRKNAIACAGTGMQRFRHRAEIG